MSEECKKGICDDCDLTGKYKTERLTSFEAYCGECCICNKKSLLSNYITEDPHFNIKNAIKSYTDFMNMTERFYELQPFIYDKNKMWWLWDNLNSKWTLVDEIDLLNKLDYTLEQSYITTTIGVRNQIIECMKRIGRLKNPQPIPKTWIQFKSKIIDIETKETFMASPNYFVTNPIPYELGVEEETPVMDHIFEEWVGKDYVKTLYEIIAFCLAQEYFMHRLVCLIGSGRNGKSKFLELVNKFIGRFNCTSSEMELLFTNRFEKAKLYKKLVCFMGELNFSEMSNTQRLKRLTGQDYIGFEFKGRDGFDDYNVAKMLVSTNSLPMTIDKTEGFYSRWLIINFPNQFSEEKDILRDIPEYEYNNLAKKTVRILEDLWKNRIFSNEGSISDKEKRYEDFSNPLKKFLFEETNDAVDGFIFKYELKKRFEDYCKLHKYRLWTDTEIGRYLKPLYDESKRQADWYSNDSNDKPYIRVWLGLKWK